MRLPHLTCSLALILLCVSLHHNVQEVQASWAALGKVAFAVGSLSAGSLSIASWYTEGCIYYPSICELQDDIPQLEAEATALTEELSADANNLKALYESNVDLYNIIYQASVKNERIIGNLENIEKYSYDILEILQYISNVDLPTLDSTAIDENKDNIDEQLAVIETHIADIEEAARYKKIRDGVVRISSLSGTGLYYGYQLYSYYKTVYATNPKAVRVQAPRMSIMTATGLRQRVDGMALFMANNPRFTKAMTASLYGISAFMSGLGIGLDIKNANDFRKKLEEVSADLKNIINDYNANKAKLDELIEEQETIQTESEAEFENVKTTFLENTAYLEALRSSSSASQDADLQSVPVFTTDNIDQYNIISNQNLYLDFLILEVETYKGLYNRVNMVSFISEYVKHPIQEQYPTVLSILVIAAKSLDETATRDIVLYSIADALPDRASWPDMDLTTQATSSVTLAPYRGVV
ncbi:unnamed protein product [Owenia fusiformis]|uniref:Uncharacterized protein n=1 Tax=Owenia fusiformis TaxID=6347 RepID=A0A8J1TXT6_OWEFU|nr:unnamed protein product [Owenia fusiformis]